MRLFFKILVSMLIVGSVPLLILAVWVLGDVEDTMSGIFEKTYMSIASQVGKEVHRTINGAYNTVDLLAENSIFHDESVSVEEKKSLLFKTLQMYPSLRDIALLNSNGEIVTSVWYSFIGSWKSTKWFGDALGGLPVFSKVHAVIFPFHLVMTVGIPIIVSDGEVVNVLMAQIDMNQISQITMGVDVGPRGNLYVVDEEDVIIAAENSDLLLEGMETVYSKDAEPLFNVESSLGKTDGAVEVPWKIVITLPWEEVMAPLVDIRNTLIIASSISIILVITLSFTLSEVLTSRLRNLVASSRVLARGEFPTQVENYGRDEIGLLADTFYKSVEQIKSYSKSLVSRNEELQQFAYVVSHDLKEPLRMISSYLGLLERRYASHLDSTACEYIGFAVGGAGRMERLLSDLLTFSRIDRPASDVEQINIAEIIAIVEQNLEIAIEINGAQIKCNDPPETIGEKSQLIQLFQNLIENAIKFNNPGTKVEIEIGGSKGSKVNTYWVKDNGIGINIGQRERIFQIFQRLHTSKEYDGTGIGLAICKRIVDRHGGGIWVESKSEYGATFYFTIPNSASPGKQFMIKAEV